ncbi:hypothetical protein H310_10866 [Aphanomyces invadans]|uniref:Reverse transcriptase RNase H-like domain-containing protein n=1 Tax=Aphanomyces invadans TaxID=157072 RepID=A0A024TQC7_9STRA|nr:hypothetical protein H310_10866 [Aphanomyces invadans]ETV95821.1 hypothetical protein H310_10866 [Aphanomyces invadans]|eukprot:XP_008875572.1 hypothetical protein H310_10866 [Aphanomyces invadans]
MFAGQLYRCLLAWLDDLLGYETSPAGLLRALAEVLEVCAVKGLKLHPKKCQFFVREAKCSSQRTPAAAITSDGDLQHFDVLLADVGWDESHVAAVEATKKALTNLVELSHPKPDMRLCVFADASEEHWDHEPLMFLSGIFTGAASRWSIVEKEAYAIVETLVRADYLLHPSAGFNLYTDHRNLKFIFSPTAVVASVPKYTAQKLERWALLLMGYNYEIHDIPGESNVWADLLSQWGSPRKSICAITSESLLVSPLRSNSFKWPTLAAIALAQRDSLANNPTPPDPVVVCELSDQDQHRVVLDDGEPWVLRLVDGMLWIPDDATGLQLRLCVFAHASLAGHRPAGPTLASLAKFCRCSTLKADVKFFRRPLSALCQCFGRQPNGLLHWDFVYMGDSKTGDSEWRMATTQWSEIHLVVILILNQLPSPSHGNVAPVNAMSGRPAMSPLDTIALPGLTKSATLEEVNASQRDNIDKARAALDAMHKVVAETNAKKRAQARKSHDAKLGDQMAQFVVGDYVLCQDVWMHKRAKLRTTWCGPAVVTNVASNWVYDVRNLVTGEQ